MSPDEQSSHAGALGPVPAPPLGRRSALRTLWGAPATGRARLGRRRGGALPAPRRPIDAPPRPGSLPWPAFRGCLIIPALAGSSPATRRIRLPPPRRDPFCAPSIPSRSPDWPFERRPRPPGLPTARPLGSILSSCRHRVDPNFGLRVDPSGQFCSGPPALFLREPESPRQCGQEYSMSNKSHAASKPHHDAAADHEAAALHHRQAAFHHDQGENENAKKHSTSAQEHSMEANDKSKSAHQHSTK